MLLSRDGELRAVDDSVAPIRDAEGRVLGAVLVFRDITERRRAEREREHVRRRFVATRRHTMQVDFDGYLSDLERELRAGRNRSGRGPKPAAAPGSGPPQGTTA